MSWDKTARLAGFGSPRFHPGVAFLEIAQALLPILVRKGSRIPNRSYRLSAAVKFIIVTAGIQPTCRIWDKPPLILGLV